MIWKDKWPIPRKNVWTVAEFDDKIMENSVANHKTITEREVLDTTKRKSLRSQQNSSDGFVEVPSKTKVFKPYSTSWWLMPSPLDKDNIKGTNPDALSRR